MPGFEIKLDSKREIDKLERELSKLDVSKQLRAYRSGLRRVHASLNKSVVDVYSRGEMVRHRRMVQRSTTRFDTLNSNNINNMSVGVQIKSESIPLIAFSKRKAPSKLKGVKIKSRKRIRINVDGKSTLLKRSFIAKADKKAKRLGFKTNIYQRRSKNPKSWRPQYTPSLPLLHSEHENKVISRNILSKLQNEITRAIRFVAK